VPRPWPCLFADVKSALDIIFNADFAHLRVPQLIPHRKTLRRFENPGQYRFLTFSCYQRLGLFNNPAIRDSFALHLAQVKVKYGFLLFAWVVMPEHIHLLVEPKLPESSMTEVLVALKNPFASTVIKRWRTLDAPVLDRIHDEKGKARFWMPGGGYDRNLYSPAEVEEKIEYIHMNPVKRNLVSSPLEWKWSSARWFAGIRDEGWPTIDPVVF
jgi:putative transposase